ncbi:MAG: glutamine synthetase adenylyltransferase, partial [Fuerstia sp.]|nr:glutamine synthetase adenylyltransferase [Fuerstiella sp.]
MLPSFDNLTESQLEANVSLFRAAGFSDPEAAVRAMMRITSLWRDAFEQKSESKTDPAEEPPWYWSLQRVCLEAPLKDFVLNVVDQYVRNAHEQFDVFALINSTPRALGILARLACASPFLTQTLLADPPCLTTLALHGRTSEMKSREQFAQEATNAMTASGRKRPQMLSELRRFQRREVLRIGMCDAFGLLDLRFVTLQLSLLADAMVECCLDLALTEAKVADLPLAVISLGKHGGEELNYSSDIDLVLICDQDSAVVQRVARLTIDGLAEDMPPGFLYRVDLRLRPWGEAGPLVNTISGYADYLIQDAATWEKQAMLKARVVAGDMRVGKKFLKRIRPLLFTDSAVDIRRSIQQMKERIEFRLRQRGKLNSEVKLGVGSIRDVEFLVQSLQLIHGELEPRVLNSNTLDSLVRLAEFGLISAEWYRHLRAGYVFLRTVEHSLQLLHNQQTHELPVDERQREWLAHRMDYPDAATLMRRFDEHRHAVRSIFDECLQFESTTLHSVAAAESMIAQAPATMLDTVLSWHALQERQLRLEEIFAGVDAGTEAIVSLRQIPARTDHWDLIVCGKDFSGWLSVICGLLSIYHLDIRRGDALTGEGINGFGDHCVAGRFLACFEVRLEVPATEPLSSLTFAENLATSLQEEIGRLGQQSRGSSIEDVRAELLTRFCDAVPQQSVSEPTSADVDVELIRLPDSVLTQMNITGADSWGFLYELASALSLSRFRVLRAIIDAEGSRVRDVLYVRERNGRPIESEERLQELQLAATLIKQFTHWLPTTNDPHHALARFRDLVSRLQPAVAWFDNMKSLRRPNVLHAVARVLGISQYLWEAFLQSRHQQLFPLLTNPEELAIRECRETLMLELDQACDRTYDATAAWAALNEFKDRHLFRIDMRHVLGHCRPFGAFSEELTELAELVVCRALEIAWRQLVPQYGQPLCEDGITECPWVVAGLGKFGGIEMGFASDIELMLIFAEAGRTAGADSVSNAVFFDHLVNAVASGIAAPQDGIFHVDLRMRPFGQAGSGAVSLHDFEKYYAADGPAWPYERQALVKFRCVAGNTGFRAAVTVACHRAIYGTGQFDFVAMRAMRERQIRQLVHGGAINVKLSDGGIVDCEYAVQALQMTFGDEFLTLRHPNTLRTLSEAARLSLIDPAHRQSIERAYVFLRELIDCLRMVRGNAKDLTLPTPGTRDWKMLARRLKSIHDSDVPLEELEA